MLRFGVRCASLLAMASGVYAQEILTEAVVTAQRREERLHDVPLTVTALMSDQLEKSGVSNIFDLQNVVSGLSFGGVGNYTQPSIRGLSTLVSTNGSENPNALYVDGVYYSQAQLLGANLPDVKRIEVLKGPQGTLFGRNSVGGAIRVFTKDPTFEPNGDFTIESGMYTGAGDSRSAPRVEARGFVSWPLIDQIAAVSFSGDYDWTDGFLTEDTTGDQFGVIRRANARTKLLWQPSDSVRAVLSGFYLKHDDEGLQSQTPLDGLVVASAYPGSTVPTVPYHTAYDSGLGLNFNEAMVRAYGFSANVEMDLADIGKLTSTTAWNDNQVDNLTTLAHAKASARCVATFACIDYSYFSFTEAFSQELNFSSEEVGIFRFTTGLFYYDQRSGTDSLIQATIVPGGIPSQIVRFGIQSYAGYGEVQAQATDKLTLIAGGRYTHEPHEDAIIAPTFIERNETFNSFVPRLTAKYDLSPQLNVYATYSEGEKSGLSGVANSGSIPPFKEVAPEENNAYEIGLKYAAAGFNVNVAGFFYDYQNKQEQGFTGTAVILQNTGPVRIYGLDADTTFRLSPEFTLRGNASWVPEAAYRDFPDAVAYGISRAANGTFSRVVFDATGYRLARAPEVTANLSLGYEHQTGRGAVDVSTNLSYSSAVYHDIYHVIRQPSYATLSARAGYRFGDSGLRVGTYGRNLTDEDYIAHGFSSGQGFTVGYARPREIGLWLSYSY